MDIYHYGIKRRSGRYPYGSGDRPYQDLEKVSKVDYGNRKDKKNKKVNDNTKKIIFASAAVIGISAAIYLGYKYNAVERIKDILNDKMSLPLKNISKNNLIKDCMEKSMTSVKEMIDTEGNRILKEGGTIYRVSGSSGIDYSKVVNKPVFGSYKNKDVSEYILGLENFSGSKERYLDFLEISKDLKGPSKEKAVEIFNYVFKNNKEYKEKLIETLAMERFKRYHPNWKNYTKEQTSEFIRRNKTKVTEQINNDPFFEAIHSISFDKEDSKILLNEFRKRGYDYITDYHDSESWTENPIILLNTSESVKKVKDIIIGKEVKEKALNYLNELLIK